MRRLYSLYLLVILILFTPAVARGGQPLQTMHMHKEVSNGQAPLIGKLPANKTLQLSIALPLRNEQQLDQLLNELYNPKSSAYHQFLSVQEFTDLFGPTQKDYEAAMHFAEAHGLTVTDTSPNRLVLDVEGTVQNIERAFNVSLGVYQHPSESRTFYSPDKEPSVKLSFPLWHVTGLSNFSKPRPASLGKGLGVQGNALGSGPGGEFIGSDLRAAYYGGNTLTGAGQSVGLLEFGGFNISDVLNYFSLFGQPLNVPLQGISVDGTTVFCNYWCEDTEQALDIEEVISMAPGLTHVVVYVGNSDVRLLNRMARDNIAKSLSSSWSWLPADPRSDDPYFKEMAAQGQTFFQAAGDNGAFARGQYVYPADDAYVTSVGGTSLTTVTPGGAWQSESIWSFGGGGISPDNIGIPSYQTAPGVITAANEGSRRLRNSPDVSAQAQTNNFICYDGVCAGGWGGTSFSAPIWAGYMALVNQQAVANKRGTLGFLNPTIYNIGLSNKYGINFHDITTGSNGFPATPGYNLAGGWGSPQPALINTLAAPIQAPQPTTPPPPPPPRHHKPPPHHR